MADALPSHKQRYRIATFAGLLGTSFSSGKTIDAANVRERPGYFIAVPETRSEIVVPIAFDAAVFGILNSESEATEWYTSDRRSQLERLAAALGRTLPSFGWRPSTKPDELPWIQRKPKYREG